MARFDHLELGGPTPEETPPGKAARKSRAENRDWLKQAGGNRRMGQYENALRFYSRALEDDKSLVSGWAGQVQMLVQLNELPEADLWARKALELFPANGDLLAARAQAVGRLGDKQQAMALCDGSLAAQGGSAYRWQVRGEMMLLTGQAIDAHCFDKAQQLDRDWLVPLESALIYLHHNLASKAQGRARAAVDLAPDQHYSWYVLGSAQAKLGLTRQAGESLNECLKLSPNHLDATARISELKSGTGWSHCLRRLFGRG